MFLNQCFYSNNSTINEQTTPQKSISTKQSIVVNSVSSSPLHKKYPLHYLLKLSVLLHSNDKEYKTKRNYLNELEYKLDKDNKEYLSGNNFHKIQRNYINKRMMKCSSCDDVMKSPSYKNTLRIKIPVCLKGKSSQQDANSAFNSIPEFKTNVEHYMKKDESDSHYNTNKKKVNESESSDNNDNENNTSEHKKSFCLKLFSNNNTSTIQGGVVSSENTLSNVITKTKESKSKIPNIKNKNNFDQETNELIHNIHLLSVNKKQMRKNKCYFPKLNNVNLFSYAKSSWHHNSIGKNIPYEYTKNLRKIKHKVITKREIIKQSNPEEENLPQPDDNNMEPKSPTNKLKLKYHNNDNITIPVNTKEAIEELKEITLKTCNYANNIIHY